MRFDVVGDACRNALADFGAEPAERFGGELRLGAPAPTLRPVPGQIRMGGAPLGVERPIAAAFVVDHWLRSGDPHHSIGNGHDRFADQIDQARRNHTAIGERLALFGGLDFLQSFRNVGMLIGDRHAGAL
ncbi:MAG: hypothetical protein AB7O04_12820 [Hyphomonadaceae bacterium]